MKRILFVFAHQDDEFGVFGRINDAIKAGEEVICAYFTNGGKGYPVGKRNQESISVLARLGVKTENVFFAGDKLSIEDGQLIYHIEKAFIWLKKWLEQHSIHAIYAPAWEGGHPDHDALHAISVYTAQQLGSLALVRQFPLYNANGCFGPFFKVFSPIKGNGPINRRFIAWGERLFFIRLFFHYPSQIKSFVGLLPFIIIHYLVYGVELEQPASIKRLSEKPHSGVLYYERRKFLRWKEMEKRLREWVVSLDSKPMGSDAFDDF